RPRLSLPIMKFEVVLVLVTMGVSPGSLWRATAPVFPLSPNIGTWLSARCDGEHKTALSGIAEVPMGRGFLNRGSDWVGHRDAPVRLLNRRSGWRLERPRGRTPAKEHLCAGHHIGRTGACVGSWSWNGRLAPGKTRPERVSCWTRPRPSRRRTTP